MHRHAETGNGRPPAPRTEQDRALIAQEVVEFPELTRDLILALLRQIQIRLDPVSYTI